MKITIADTVDETLQNLAVFFVETAQRNIQEKGRFSIALSGGSSPKKLYELLVAQHAHDLDWKKVHFFFGDERYVPHTDPDSNYLMAKQTLFDPLFINPLQVYAVDTSLEPRQAAEAYTETILKFFHGEKLSFDLILLGLGDNSHTASLFPYTSILADDSQSVKEVFLNDQGIYRISFTAPLINQADRTAFLVYGAGKAEAVRHVIEDPIDIEQFPAQLIIPVNGYLDWFLDRAAAAELSMHY
ncbi:6-phosphogluconolactonase [Siphonobacter sp. BAB-5405]|uniref:6-phosphogluconolactonase n=1 Tax=Siphonobacter sp. BAB-5405 TaxID=1864825 RepID=UPI000C7FA803|nr:6-phosphogluconolactonase [Siphonobacter sp. BAB-5405]PMD90460.1 6-phosphogluconolactonase [Siphonobacter sp. BAB-5405]